LSFFSAPCRIHGVGRGEHGPPADRAPARPHLNLAFELLLAFASVGVKAFAHRKWKRPVLTKYYDLTGLEASY
jgi:hypothetical protein